MGNIRNCACKMAINTRNIQIKFKVNIDNCDRDQLLN